LEPDDGSGWVKVADSRGADGLVPASYLDHEATPSAGATPAGRKQGTGTYGESIVPPASSHLADGLFSFHSVKAIYQYVANGPDEIGLEEGELIELSSGPTGGERYGEGWWEGEEFPVVN